MANEVYLLSDAPVLTEGLVCQNGDLRVETRRSALVPADGAPGLAPLLEQAGWQEGGAVVIVPTQEVSFRKLTFPFREPKRIRQVLPLELESELLDDVKQYVFDHDLAPIEDQAMEAGVFLLRADRLAQIVAACQQHGLRCQRVTFAAQALVALRPPSAPLEFQVYVGADECFVSLVRKGRVEALKSFTSALSGMLRELFQQGVRSAADIHRLLVGEEEEAKVNRGLLRSRLVSELQAVAAEVNLFVRIHGLGQSPAVSFFGLYGPYFTCNGAHPGSGPSVALALAEQRVPEPPPRTLLGILGELPLQPRALLARRGFNFNQLGSGWQALLGEVRRPLITLGVLGALLLGLLAVQYAVTTLTLRGQLAQTDAQIQQILARRVSPNVPPLARLAVLQEQAQKLRDQAKSASRFDAYQYDVLALLQDVSVAVGAGSGVTVDTLEAGAGRLSLTGTTPSYQDTEALRDRLSALARFKERQPKLSHQRTGQTITYHLAFE